MSKPLNFQEIIHRLDEYWAEQGCLIWHPYNVEVGAGTMNPATVLRVLGPEPWNVGYPEPSLRPADGRYGENPNRMQLFYQYQVILKPDPGNPQELYLDSLGALGIDWQNRDIRFVEDNWEARNFGAWGLGWEVWLDGLEISQYTYFQESGTVKLEPISVELTYGLERLAMFLQGVQRFTDIRWHDDVTYGDMHLAEEVERCEYNFDYADVDRLNELYDLYEAEARNALKHDLVMPAHDYVLKCSHAFNLLDARGAVGVTERARYFARMRDLARAVSEAYIEQREEMGYPFLEREGTRLRAEKGEDGEVEPKEHEIPDEPRDFVLEIGTEELPAGDLNTALAQLNDLVPEMLEEARLDYDAFRLAATPRRLAVFVEGLAPSQRRVEQLEKGPPATVGFDDAGGPTQAAKGFAASVGVPVGELGVREFDGKEFVTAVRMDPGQSTSEILPEIVPDVVGSLQFPLAMRWNETGVSFSRPIRWIVALHGGAVVPFEFAGVQSGRTSRGTRPAGSPDLPMAKAEDYFKVMKSAAIVVDPEVRRRRIEEQLGELAAEVGGYVPDEPEPLGEVIHLVEEPSAIRGDYDPAFLALPREVLTTVMKVHQRYFPIVENGELLPHFITVANGSGFDRELVRRGNEEVIRARFADAQFFYEQDTSRPLEEFVSELGTLTFQEELGSYLDKTRRLEVLAAAIGETIDLDPDEVVTVRRAATLCKADLVTDMVIELTSLQGAMGREYALQSGERPEVAQAIFEHYLPRSAGDDLPESGPGIALSLADRLDSLVGLFSVGLQPTGSSDPYALRRAALGLVQILIEREISLSLEVAVGQAAEEYGGGVRDEDDVLAFIRRRLQGWLLDQGFRHDLVEAVLAEQSDDPFRAYETVKDLSDWVDRGEFDELLTAYSRSVRIVRDFEEEFELDPDKFVEPATERLCEAYLAGRKAADDATNLDELFNAMLPLVEPINAFFDDVLVMAEDQELRENRLALLQRIAKLPEGVVDLSKVRGF